MRKKLIALFLVAAMVITCTGFVYALEVKESIEACEEEGLFEECPQCYGFYAMKYCSGRKVEPERTSKCTCGCTIYWYYHTTYCTYCHFSTSIGQHQCQTSCGNSVCPY